MLDRSFRGRYISEPHAGTDRAMERKPLPWSKKPQQAEQPQPQKNQRYLGRTYAGKLSIDPTRRGVNLYWRGRGEYRCCPGLQRIIDVCRGWRRVQAGDDVQRGHYLPIDTHLSPTESHFFLCALVPGDYAILPCADGGEALFWIDLETRQVGKPVVSSEVRAVLVRQQVGKRR